MGSWLWLFYLFIYGYKQAIEYIKNQHEHHQRISFEEEYRKLLLDYGITPDEKFFP
jgi:hypothetical protein